MADFTPKNAEEERLAVPDTYKNWKKWGPYLAERQWGTVREDYSEHGHAWDFIGHEKARSNAYRWGEEGIGGFCDSREILCLAPAFWNGKDPILKERLFGLTNNQGNHGEDVKELYFHQISTPTHSYCKYLYKYPHKKFPYQDLINNNIRSREDMEYELLDTNSFDKNAYFDCYIEYTKADVEDILMKITVVNRGNRKARIHVLPHLWFRNFWKHNKRFGRPSIKSLTDNCIQSRSIRNGRHYFYHENGKQLFCENETNNKRIYNVANEVDYVKDGINDHVVNGKSTVNPAKIGSKSAVWYKFKLKAGEERSIRIRLSKKKLENPWSDFDAVFNQRIKESEDFYSNILKSDLPKAHQSIAKSAFSGLLWTKQFYYYDVFKWLFGGPGEPKPFRAAARNFNWQHLTNRHVISMPDKWEYPWYAAWDLAFHMVSFVEIDPYFAKEQLLLVLRENYMHPNGQIPAYEWNFSDVNPPVHSWAVWNVYEKDKFRTGNGDTKFLEHAFQKLLINFTWWVNQKDKHGTDLFEGGFLGLDNIGVFDRNHMPQGVSRMQQADATSWMAMFTVNMLRMSLELAKTNKVYEESAAKFFRHFLNIAWAMHHIGTKDISLWDDGDDFYYDVVELSNGTTNRLKVRSLVGIIPLFAVEIIHKDLFEQLKEFKIRAAEIVRTRPDLASLISNIEEANKDGNYLFSIMRAYRLEKLLIRLLDEDEFLSDYGIRSLSKYHKDHPFVFSHNGHYTIHYEPGESRSNMFGGNSNWRGPIWMPLNYMIIQSLRKYYTFYGPTYQYEFPTGSGKKLNLNEIANQLTKRLVKLFEANSEGKFQYHADDRNKLFAQDEHFKNQHLFYEFFDGDNGKGLGASHQTGWTALIANLIMEMEESDQ
ncbi:MULTISPECIES: MGH1-like glycoside hydrolase domain-containing protein [unclassified Arenibacter]|uniref:MGH1-like glycoside hydrolase domain-containing protein n=1 Tax=unclassified Arenibacter TaxID=2615047 RepID=UPI000E34DABF|nr:MULTISPECIES: glucosidase [unclassified Arenibacter]MCM4166022.1 glucosidase [Arenibacter sp. A80]RFT54341.1 glucosidase [Arenibacter sp. P308M17]